MEMCSLDYPKMCISTIVTISDTTVRMSAKVKSITSCFVHPLKSVILISFIIARLLVKKFLVLNHRQYAVAFQFLVEENPALLSPLGVIDNLFRAIRQWNVSRL